MRALSAVFPTSVILLCHFHVIKWMLGIFKSAPVSLEVKGKLMDIFKELVYARYEEVFKLKIVEWYKLIDGVEVKVVSGGRYVKLAEYYDRNWANIVPMWAIYEQKRLPLGAEHTTNRIERTFRSMKDELSTYNIGEVSMAKAVFQLITWAENQLEDRYITAQRHRMQLFDADPLVADLYRSDYEPINYHQC